MNRREGRRVDEWMKSHCNGTLPDVVFFHFNLDFNSIFTVEEENQWLFLKKRCTIFTWFDDLHFHDSVTEWRMKTAMRRSTEVLGTYMYLFRSWYPLQATSEKNITWLPHSASSSFTKFLQPNFSASNSMLVSGNLEPRFYPCRSRAALSVDNHTSFLLPHPDPGYNDRKRNDYSSLLREHAFALATNSVGYILAKCFEIPATGTVAIIDNKSTEVLKLLGFQEGKNYFGFNCSIPEGFQTPVGVSDLSDVLQSLLQENMQKKVQAVRLEGMQFVKSFHTTSHRVVQVLYRIAAHVQSKTSRAVLDENLLKPGHCFNDDISIDIPYPWYVQQRDLSI